MSHHLRADPTEVTWECANEDEVRQAKELEVVSMTESIRDYEHEAYWSCCHRMAHGYWDCATQRMSKSDIISHIHRELSVVPNMFPDLLLTMSIC